MFFLNLGNSKENKSVDKELEISGQDNNLRKHAPSAFSVNVVHA